MTMFMHYESVLAATGAAAAALSLTFVTNWLRQRASGFLVTWAAGLGIVVSAIICFGVYDATRSSVTGAIGCLLLTTALAVFWGGQVQFRDGKLPLGRMGALFVLVCLPGPLVFAAGYQGVGYLVVNLVVAGLLAYVGWRYWQIRAESPVALGIIAALHNVLAISFALCAFMVVWERHWEMQGMPQNWAEIANLICSVIAMTSVGGLFITIYQERIARSYKTSSLTDPLTGLANRRALYDHFENSEVPTNAAISIFDLDDFKGVNDRFGHGVGDQVLVRFARLLEHETRSGDLVVRLGGEEFCAISKGDADEIYAMAERIRTQFMAMPLQSDDQTIVCTVSAGIAVVGKGSCSLDTLLRKADDALYRSKRNGRNQVSGSRPQLAA